MEVSEALQKRRSIRKYTDEPVSHEDLDYLMHCAMSGPSAVNRRPWDLYVVTDPMILAKLRQAGRYTDIHAPCAIVVCGSLSRALPMQLSEYWIQDCSAATENILIGAVSIGLGTVWCGIYPQKNPMKKVAEALNLTNKQIPLNIIFTGHPDQTPEPRDQYEEKRIHWL